MKKAHSMAIANRWAETKSRTYTTLLLLGWLANQLAVGAEPAAFDTLPGFQVERLYEVPAEQGSWVAMTFDEEGRIIASHEGGGLYRITLSVDEGGQTQAAVEKLSVNIGGAQGLLYAFGSLYAMSGGIVRLQDTNGDDQYDSVQRLIEINGRGEHGPHALVVDPQRKWIYCIAGNLTRLPDLTQRQVVGSRGEKELAPGGPQGWAMRISPDGKQRQLYCIGLRNAYGLAFSPSGDLFTFDSDNEGYMGLPWYRPTNIYHLVSGADFGWRQGPDTLPPYAADIVPPVLEVGPGSPTGMTFGTTAKFPEKYHRALFVGDWSYGRIFAIHLRPQGASYTATQELFLSGRPLAVTDLRIGPDGAMYFLTGGRGTSSALYRLWWAGSADVVQPLAVQSANQNTRLRRRLEALHTPDAPEGKTAVDTAWPHLQHADRFVRYAARVAVEHQPVRKWQARALSETNQTAQLEGLIALARQGEPDVRDRLLSRASELNWNKLTLSQRLSLLRLYDLIFQRMGIPKDPEQRDRIVQQLNPHFPAANDSTNRELATCLVNLRAPNLGDRLIEVIKDTPTAMRQIHFLLAMNRSNEKLREEQRVRLLAALDLTAIEEIANRGRYKDVSEMMSKMLKHVGDAPTEAATSPKRPIVKQWTIKDLAPLVTDEDLSSRNGTRGRTVFRQAQCHRCHRIRGTGGVLGPNLTRLAGRYKPRDVLEAIIDPDKVIPDQYRTTLFTKTDGTQFTGQIVNLQRGQIQIRLDPSRPFPRVAFAEADIAAMRLSDVSLMPKGTLDTFTADEIRDLIAYLLQPDKSGDKPAGRSR